LNTRSVVSEDPALRATSCSRETARLLSPKMLDHRVAVISKSDGNANASSRSPRRHARAKAEDSHARIRYIGKHACKIVRAVHVRAEGEARTWVTLSSCSTHAGRTRFLLAGHIVNANKYQRTLPSYLPHVNYPRSFPRRQDHPSPAPSWRTSGKMNVLLIAPNFSPSRRSSSSVR